MNYALKFHRPQNGVLRKTAKVSEFWFGYKGHLAVGTSSQYILQSFFSSKNLNDRKATIPPLKGIEYLKLSNIRYQTMDAGYDYDKN